MVEQRAHDLDRAEPASLEDGCSRNGVQAYNLRMRERAGEHLDENPLRGRVAPAHEREILGSEENLVSLQSAFLAGHCPQWHGEQKGVQVRRTVEPTRKVQWPLKQVQAAGLLLDGRVD